MRTEKPAEGRPILVIDNGTHYLAELERALHILRVAVRRHPGTAPVGQAMLDEAGGIILTGGEVHVYRADQLEAVAESCRLIRIARVPVLGICLGCQLIAHVFGGTVGALPAPVDRPVDLQWLVADPLNAGLPGVCPMVMAHHDTVIDVPRDIVTLARSRFGSHEAIRHRTRALYGVQFHPEVSGTYGRRLLANFAVMAAGQSNAEVRALAV
jgi:GMP synthase (glutamine-hydrolysing)